MRQIFLSLKKQFLHILQKISQRNSSLTRISSKQSGFSLAEIMIAIAIVALVGGGAAIVAIGKYREAQQSQTINTMDDIQQAISTWQVNNPSESCLPGNDLDILFTNKTLTKLPRDGWEQKFKYICPSEHGNEFDLLSSGKDKKFGTEDDIKSWEKPKKSK